MNPANCVAFDKIKEKSNYSKLMRVLAEKKKHRYESYFKCFSCNNDYLYKTYEKNMTRPCPTCKTLNKPTVEVSNNNL